VEPVALRCERLSKTFFSLRGRVEALRQVTLRAEPGELLVLLGPSGCGKSTLLNLVAGLEKPTAGRVVLGERTVADAEARAFASPFERDVAMVFQSYALYPHMTVGQNIAFPLTNLRPRPGREERDRRAREAARLLRIEELLDRKPAELSGGQRQRVAIGRAIVRQPRVFLLDEPLSNLDAQLRTEMRAQLKDLQRRLGVTAVYVTHDQTEAMTLGDRIAVLRAGTVQQVGTPMDIYDHPANPFVARFVGSPPMNLFEGPVEARGDGVRLRDGELALTFAGPLAERLRAHAGQHVVLGVRPEHIDLVAPGRGNLDVTVDVVENLGSTCLLCALFEERQIVVQAEAPPEEKRVGLRFRAERVHVFAGEGG